MRSLASFVGPSPNQDQGCHGMGITAALSLPVQPIGRVSLPIET